MCYYDANALFVSTLFIQDLVGYREGLACLLISRSHADKDRQTEHHLQVVPTMMRKLLLGLTRNYIFGETFM